MNNSRYPFEIIGLRVLEECEEHLRKVLKPNTTYFFCNDYEDDGNGSVRRKSNCQRLSPTFFSLHENNQGPLMSISCLVGHNGDGKSSLIELMIRTINNFAYLSGFRSDHQNMKFVPGVYSNLFFLANNEICSITCLGEEMKVKIGGKIEEFTYTNVYKPGKERAKKKVILDFAKNLFYTLVCNYSLYAYNSCEFKSENKSNDESDSWVSALFVPNDAYQTPIVLVPRRKQGVVDINNEYSFSAQRLGELFLDCKHGKFKISNTEQVEGFAYKLESQSKLWTKTIKEYLLKKSSGARDIIHFDVDFSKNKHGIDFANKDVLEFNQEFWNSFDLSFFDTNLLNLAQNLTEKETDKRFLLNNTDFGQYLKKIKTLVQKRQGKSSVSANNIQKMIAKGGGALTFLQFQRIYLVYEIMVRWMRLLKIDDSLIFPLTFSTDNPINHALWYLTYKTIKVIESYPDYFSGGIADYEIPQHFFHNEVRKKNINNWFDLLQKDIKNKQSHITIKIRRTLFFLEHCESFPLLNHVEDIPDNLKRVCSTNDYDFYIDCEKYYKNIKKVRDLANAIPPPIFVMDYLISRNDESMYPLSRMSSGERQLLNSSSSIVYHLKNIAHSYSSGTKLAYENVNVVLEEVELYFHPEYQRRFVKYLLEQIENAHLPAKMSINLIFVTHSPFILSDIPRQNVLFLKDGSPDRSMQEDTFGANIHTLLQNGFFLNSVPIGAFAKEKISQMFALLNQSNDISEDNLNRLEKEILLVSEPLLRSQLMRLFTMRKKFKYGDFQETIATLEKRIQILEERLYDKN